MVAVFVENLKHYEWLIDRMFGHLTEHLDFVANTFE